MDKVYIGIRWIELFGEHKTDMPDQLRRERWEEWKRLKQDRGQMGCVEFFATAGAMIAAEIDRLNNVKQKIT